MTTSTTQCPLCGGPARPHLTLPHTQVFRCAGGQCDLQFASPQLNDHDLAQAYAQLYYRPDGSQPVLENTPEPDIRHLLDRLSRKFGSLSGKCILDYGCGNGLLLKIANELGARATGVEQSSTAREGIAREGFATVYADLAALHQAEPAAQFDLIILSEVIEHLRRPWDDLEQLSPLLTRSGSVVLLTPNFASLNSRLHAAGWEQRTNLTHLFYFTPRSLAAVLRRAGYDPIALPPISWHSSHDLLRRQLQHMLCATGLQGGLFFCGQLRAATSVARAAS